MPWRQSRGCSGSDGLSPPHRVPQRQSGGRQAAQPSCWAAGVRHWRRPCPRTRPAWSWSSSPASRCCPWGRPLTPGGYSAPLPTWAGMPLAITRKTAASQQVYGGTAPCLTMVMESIPGSLLLSMMAPFDPRQLQRTATGLSNPFWQHLYMCLITPALAGSILISLTGNMIHRKRLAWFSIAAGICHNSCQWSPGPGLAALLCWCQISSHAAQPGQAAPRWQILQQAMQLWW